MANEKLRINGLANIGALMSRVPTANVDPKPADQKQAIVAKTVERGGFSCGDARLIEAAVNAAFNLGHAQGMLQMAEVEELLKKQHENRTKLTMPTVVAAVMEQLGMTELVLDLNAVTGVFDRTRIEMNIAEVPDEKGDLIEYKLFHLADEVKA